MQIIVGTTPVLVDITEAYPDRGRKGQVLVIQNLGTGDIYLDFSEDVDADSGLKVSADGVYELTSGQGLYVVASVADTDVRVLAVG